MFKSLAYEAMLFAIEKHKNQVRKYTGEPYFNHLAEVVAISMSVGWQASMIHPDKVMAVAWLHDVIEDCGVLWSDINLRFGCDIADGVMQLSEVYSGNRKTRKKIMRDVLGDAPGWIQTIKCADLISNATSIIKHDPEFAKVFRAEAVALLDVMDKADSRLRDMAYSVVCKNEKNENREMSKMLEE